MGILIGIIITRFIFSIRLWVAEALFGSQASSTKILLFVGGILIALRLLLFPSVVAIFGIEADFFGLHSSVVIASIIGYAILAAHEEILKFAGSYIRYLRAHLTRNDLILYSIFIALGFSFGENIIYVVRETQGIADASSLAFTRGITGFIGHALFTGSIGYIASRMSGKKQILGIIGGLLVGILLHGAYNLILHYGIMSLFMLYMCGAYFLLTYLFYQSDRVYLP